MPINNKGNSKNYTSLHEFSLRYLPYRFLAKFGIKNIDPVRVSETTLVYLSLVLIHSVIFFSAVLYANPENRTVFFLLFLVSVVTGAWLGGQVVGIISIFFAVMEAAYLFIDWSGKQSFFLQAAWLDITMLAVAGLITSSLIDLLRHSKELNEYKRKERDYARNFIHLHTAISKARREIQARDEFLSLASHELKTPLTTMLLKLHNMLHTVRNVSLANFSVPALMRVLENAQQQTRNLSNMINDLLNVSLITTGRLKLDKEDTDLNNIVRNVLENFSEMLKENKYKVRFVAQKKIRGRWDKNRIEQAVINLVSNAIKYGEGKPLEIRLENHKNSARFTIHDNGIGISKEDQKILFERFSRALTSKEYKKGLGVGLYITYQIIKAHDGSVRVHSQPGKGATFTVELPLHPVK